jgi:hypothetical protein
VSALNAAQPADRIPWTPQSLFSFIAAFTTVKHDESSDAVAVTWLRPPADVVSLLLRGTIADDNQPALQSMLADECGEVFETLQPMARHEHEGPADAAPAETMLAADGESAEAAPAAEPAPETKKGNPLFRIAAAIRTFKPVVVSAHGVASVGQKVAGSILNTAAQKQRHMRDRKIIANFAKALLDGGLSSRECRELLLLHDLAAEDIDAVLSTEL